MDLPLWVSPLIVVSDPRWMRLSMIHSCGGGIDEIGAFHVFGVASELASDVDLPGRRSVAGGDIGYG